MHSLPVAQYSAASTVSILVWSSLFIVLVILGFVLVLWVKRRLRDDSDAKNVKPLGFSLSDLRELHRNGHMSDEEFERAKEKIIGAAKARTANIGRSEQ